MLILLLFSQSLSFLSKLRVGSRSHGLDPRLQLHERKLCAWDDCVHLVCVRVFGEAAGLGCMHDILYTDI